jgi:ankyrin repeat protein
MELSPEQRLLDISFGWFTRRNQSGYGQPLQINNEEFDDFNLLIENITNIDAFDFTHSTALHWAVKSDYIDGIRILCANGANVNVTDERGNLPIHYTSFGNGVSASILIEYGTNINANNTSGNTPLHIAISEENEEVFDVLLQNGANVKAIGFNDLDPLHLSLRQELRHHTRGLNILNKLLEHPDNDINTVGNPIMGYSPLYISIASNIEKVRLLIEKGANVNHKTSMGVTPLQLAIRLERPRVVEILLQNGALVEPYSALEKTGENTWMEYYERENLNPDILRILKIHEGKRRRAKTLTDYVTRNQKEDIPDDMKNEIKSYYGGNKRLLKYHYKQMGGTPEEDALILAINNKDAQEVERILKNSYNQCPYIADPDMQLTDSSSDSNSEIECKENTDMLVNHQNSDGLTPLVIAFQTFEDESIQNHDYWIDDEWTPSSYQRIHKIIGILLKYHADPNIAPNNGWGNDEGDISALSPLHQVCYYNLKGLVKELLVSVPPANTMVTDLDGDTPLHLCMMNYYPVITSGIIIELIRHIKEMSIGRYSWGRRVLAEQLEMMINKQNNKEETPLFLGTYHGCSGAVEILLRNGADPDIKNHVGRTPLNSALKLWHTPAINPEIGRNEYNIIVRILLEGGADPNLSSNINGSIKVPLFIAAKSGNIDAARLLLKKGAKVNVEVPGLNVHTPLLGAISHGHVAMVRLLLQNGANPDLNTAQTDTDVLTLAGHADLNIPLLNRLDIEQILREHLSQRHQERSLVDQMSRSPNIPNRPDDIYGVIKHHFGGRKQRILKYIGGMNNPNINSTPSDSESENSAITVAVESHHENLLPDDIDLSEAMALLDRLTISNNESERDSAEYLRREILERFGLRASLLLGPLEADESESEIEPPEPEIESEEDLALDLTTAAPSGRQIEDQRQQLLTDIINNFWEFDPEFPLLNRENLDRMPLYTLQQINGEYVTARDRMLNLIASTIPVTITQREALEQRTDMSMESIRERGEAIYNEARANITQKIEDVLDMYEVFDHDEAWVGPH